MNSKNKIHNLENNLESFKELSNNIQIDESFEALKISVHDISLENFLINITNYIQLFVPFFETVDDNDKLRVSIMDNAHSLVVFESLDEINNYQYGHEYDDDIGSIEIKIFKSDSVEYVSIYSLNWFANYLNDRNIEEIFFLFSECKTIFKILDGSSHNFHTNHFIFLDNANFTNRANQIKKTFDNDIRTKRQLKINENSHFANMSTIKFIPEDFYIHNKSCNKSIYELFNKLAQALILSVFSDISEFSENSLSYKMFGYKTLKKVYDFNSFNTNFLDEYYQSYQDVFNTHTSISDKIGLARNVISLHAINDDFTNINGSILSSIRSNYNIYLKENIKKYIDIKNKITDSIFSLSNKFDEATNNLTSSFKTSFYTLATLFISLILFKVLKNSNSTLNIFTIEVFLFLCPVLIAMYLFKLYNIQEVKQIKKRLVNRYEQLQKQYTDILDSDDLKQIFNKHDFEKTNLDFIDNQSKKYNLYWNLTLLGYFIFFFIGTFCIK